MPLREILWTAIGNLGRWLVEASDARLDVDRPLIDALKESWGRPILSKKEQG